MATVPTRTVSMLYWSGTTMTLAYWAFARLGHQFPVGAPAV